MVSFESIFTPDFCKKKREVEFCTGSEDVFGRIKEAFLLVLYNICDNYVHTIAFSRKSPNSYNTPRLDRK